MNALAKIVMRGRIHAALWAFVFAGLPLLSWLAAAIVALVTLRKGATEGAVILLAAFAPALLISDTVEVTSISALLVVYVGANVLRLTMNLGISVLSLVFTSALLLVAVFSQTDGFLESYKQVLESQFQQMQMKQSLGLESQDFVHLLAVQSISYGVAFTAIAGLFVGRWWQAVLYNPGGFQKEFHELRLSPFVTVVLLMLSIAGFSSAGLLESGSEVPDVLGDVESAIGALNVAAIASLMTFPLLVAGAAIVHSIVKTKQASALWLVGFYFTLPITNAMVYLLVFVDGIVDIRRKVNNP